MSIVIDRRLNDRNKSAANRARFLRRYKEQIKKSVTDLVGERSIADMDKGGVVNIPVRDISEPSFHHGPGGDQESVHTGNHSFRPGDRLPRPDGGGPGKGKGSGGDGESEDSFTFALSREEFLQLFFDDLELPRMLRNFLGEAKDHKWQRAGYTPTGVPANLSVLRSLRTAMARRIALTGGLKRELAALQTQRSDERHFCGSENDNDDVETRIQTLEKRIARVPYLDELDLRYRHRVRVPQPISQAVMFCLMDVSASMTEEKKDLAKRFFTLLYLFLSRKYDRVQLVFIRHTDDAEEVDEQRFFHDTKSGGTVVLSALQLMHEIIGARFPAGQWNLYGAQVSDGDAFGADPEKSRAFLADELLPATRYFAYVETPDNPERLSPLMHAYKRIEHPGFACRSVTDRRGVYPLLRDLFKKEAAL